MGEESDDIAEVDDPPAIKSERTGWLRLTVYIAVPVIAALLGAFIGGEIQSHSEATTAQQQFLHTQRTAAYSSYLADLANLRYQITALVVVGNEFSAQIPGAEIVPILQSFQQVQQKEQTDYEVLGLIGSQRVLAIARTNLGPINDESKMVAAYQFSVSNGSDAGTAAAPAVTVRSFAHLIGPLVHDESEINTSKFIRAAKADLQP